MQKINTEELARELAAAENISQRKARSLLKTLVQTMQNAIVDEGKVKLKGLGKLSVTDVSARESISVNTGERVLIESYQKLTFTPDTAMKELVNRPFSMFDTVVIN